MHMRRLKTKIWVWMIGLIFPLLLVLFAYNFYTIKVLNNQIARNGLDTLSIYEKPVIKDINYISYSMANALANDASMLQLNYAAGYMEAYIYCNEIANDFKVLIQSDMEGLGALGVCSSTHNILRTVYAVRGKYSYEEKTELDKKMKELMLDENYYKAGWQLLCLESRSLLIRVLRHGNVYITIVIDFSLITKPQDVQDIRNGSMVYTAEDGTPLTMANYIKEHDIELTTASDQYYISGEKRSRYMVVWKEFAFAKVRQYYLVPYEGIFRYLDFFQILLMLVTFAMACFIPVGFYYMKKKLFNPLEIMVDTMVNIGSGQIEAQMEEDYNIDEFRRVKDAFNEMINRIKKLKINAYEQELLFKNVQMQYLQIQIRPHFFLNCLKNIYAMAKQQEYGSIEEMILLMSQYLRSMFQSNPSLISIEEEISGVKNYMALQQMSSSDPPVCNIDVDRELWQLQLPPLSIITFVENSVKHGAVCGKKLIITIRVSKLVSETEAYTCITILDNGPGFGGLDLLGPDMNYDANSKEHIGIMNIRKRIELLYHGKGAINFSYSNGACVEIYIPMEEMEAGADDSIGSR